MCLSGQEDGESWEMVSVDSDGRYLPVFFYFALVFSPKRSEHFVDVFISNMKEFTV